MSIETVVKSGFFDLKKVQLPKVLYHYCPCEKFKRIIETHNIRFSDVMKSNDREEILFLWKEYQKLFNRLYPNETATMTLPFFTREQLNSTKSLTFSLSKLPDNVHMWNTYAKKGVAIGFSTERLIDWVTRFSGMYLKPIDYYSKRTASRFIKSLCSKANSTLDHFSDIVLIAPFIKTKFSESEKEIRIAFQTNVCFEQPVCYIDGSKDRPIYLQETAETMVLYCDFIFPETMIDSIVLDQNCSMSKIQVENLLFENGYAAFDGRVNYSEGSFRE